MTETPDLMLMNQLDELAAFEPAGYPFVSLYLNLQPDQHGRDNFKSFVRKEFKTKAKLLPPESLELTSFKRDTPESNLTCAMRYALRPMAWRFSPAPEPTIISRHCSWTLRSSGMICTSMRDRIFIHWHV